MSTANDTPRSTWEGTGNGSIRVLHVDDDPDFATLAATLVERQEDRFDVETVPGASEALDRLAAADFDCVVSDYDMPGRNGIEFLEALRETHPEVPFILFTGKGSEEVASDAISAGVTDYLQKEAGTEQYAVLANRIRNAVERSRIERERRRQLDAIETAQEGISILDEDGEYIYVNRAYADLYGYDPPDLVGEPWELLYPDDETERTHEEILPAVERDGQWHGTTMGLRADGTTFVADHRLSRTERGELICTVQDRSERERYERELEAERLFIDQALDLLNEVFYVLDDDGGLRRWNERLPTVTGYTDEEIAGMCATDLFPEDERASVDAAIRETITTGDTRLEAEFLTADGAQIPYEFTGRRLTDADGNPTGLIGIGRDVTVRTRRADRLETLVDNLPGMVYRCANEPGWPMETVGGEVERLTGYPQSAFEAREGFYGDTVIHPEDRDEVWAAVQRALEAGESFEFTYRIRTADGTEKRVWERGCGIQSADGDLAALEGFVTDLPTETDIPPTADGSDR